MSSRSSLNHIYRTVWNQSLGAMVAVAEIASAGGRSSGAAGCATVNTLSASFRLKALAAGVALAWAGAPLTAVANPTGGVAVVGQATMATSGTHLRVTTQNGVGTNHSAINWQSFSVPQGSTTFFQQPNTASTSINRVVTNTPSQLFGTLGSNGNLVLVNQAGITVGAGAVVDTAGFTASSLQMSDADALAGRMRFGGGSGSGGAVVMGGTVMARSGDVVLIGSSVDTGKDALIQALNGATILVAGSAVSISSRGLEGIHFDVQAGANSAVNLGTLKGDAVGIFAGTLRHSGQIQAQALQVEGGKVLLKATELAEISGAVKASGANGLGGTIHTTANKVWLKGTALLDASAAKGGGEVLVGGGWQGKDARLSNAQISLVSQGATIKVDATEQGNAGTAVVWANGATRFDGRISAKGGVLGGNGGNVEVSGKEYLDFRGSADLLAPRGQGGTLLLDPSTLTVQLAGPADANGDGTAGDDLASLSLTSSIGASVITKAALESQLLLGSVTLTAPGDINVNAPIVYSGSGGSLTLNSTVGSITTASAISSVTGSFGLNFSAASGNISVGSLSTSGGAVNLLAGGTLAVNGALNAGSGAVSMTGNGGVSLNNAVTAGTLSLSSTNAAISQSASSITAGGAVTISAGSGDITFLQSANDFQAAVSATGGAIRIKDANALIINSIVSGTNKEIEIYAGGLLTLPSSPISTGTANLTLNSGSNFATLGALSGANIALIAASGGLTLGGAVNATGTLTLNAITDIYDSAGAFSVAANALSMSAGGFVSLTNAFNSVSSITATKTTGTEPIDYWNNGGMTLGAITTSGSLTLKSAGGAITQTGAVQIGATGSLTIDSGTGNITLTNAGNALKQLQISGSGAVDIVDSGAIQMGSPAIGSSFKLRAGGNIFLKSITTSSGVIDVQSDQVMTVATAEGINSAGALTLRGLTGIAGFAFDLTANGGGNMLLDSGSGTFLPGGYGGTVTLNGGGAWQTHSIVSASNNFAMFPDANAAFKQYGAAFGASPLGSGNGRMYSTTPVLTSAATLTGSVSKVYDGALSIGLGGATFSPITGGAVDGDSVLSAVIAGGTGTLSDPNVGTGKFVSAAGMTVSGITFAGSKPVYGYQVGSFTGNIGQVTTARAIASINLTGNRVYDGTNTVSASIFSLSGLVGSETLNLTGTGTLADKNVGVNKPVSLGSLAIGDGTGLASNYTFTGGTAIATITPAVIGAVTGISASNKVYDGTTVATVSTAGAMFPGKIATDVVTLGNASGVFVDKNAGLGKLVTIAGLTLSGADAGNYTLSSTNATASASIVPKLLTVSAVSVANKAYDGTTAATLSGGVLSGALSGDSVSLTAPTGSFVDKNAGISKPVTVSGLTLGGADAGNYSLLSNTVTASADITAKTLVASAFSALNKVYDGTRVATITGGALSGTVAGDAVSLGPVIGSFGDKNVGNGKAVTISGLTLTGSAAGNYALSAVSANAIADISAKALTVSSVSALNKVYDGTRAASLTGGNLSGAIAGDVVSLSSLTASFADKNVGTAKLVSISGGTLSGTDAANYSLNSSASAVVTADITTKQVTVSGLAAMDKIYDGTVLATVSGGTIVGAIAGDSISVRSATGTFNNKNVGLAKPVTLNGLSLGGADAANYSLLTTGATVFANITPKPVSVGAVLAANKVYDGTTTALISGGSLLGTVAGDSVTLGSLTGFFMNKNVGNSKTVVVGGLALGGADAGNYSLNVNGVTATANITPKLLAVGTVVVADRVYDGSTTAVLSGGALSGTVPGDSIALTAVVGNFADKNVGNFKAVNVSGLSLVGADIGNYILGPINFSATASITPRPLIISGITATNKVYDGKTDATLVTSGVVLTGLVGGDVVSTSAIKGAFADKNVGIGKKVSLTGLILTGGDAVNYTFSGDSVATANIDVLPEAKWLGGGSSNAWSDPKNWDALPDGSNVLAVNLPASATNVRLDSNVGAVSLQTLTSAGMLSVEGSSLQVRNGITTAGYNQTGGTVGGAGAFKVTGTFNQTGGTLAAGSVEVVRSNGDVVIGNVSSPTVSLIAQSGAIRESGSIQSATLITKSTAGTFLNAPGNQISSFTAENIGTGDIELVNKGVLTTAGVNNTGGSITVVNTGGISSLDTALITAPGPGSKVSLTANSPLSIGALGVQANGNIVLVATNLTSAGNITLNGPIESKTGSIAMTAANNFTQNSSVLAPLGVSVNVGGALTLGPTATSGYQPVSYQVNSVSVVPPRSPTSANAASELVVALMATALDPVTDIAVVRLESLMTKDKEKDRDLSKELIVSEGQLCRP